MAREASFHASKAILYDSMGAAGMAVHHYWEGIYALRMLLAAHPDTRLRLVYEARCDSYLAPDRRPGKAHGAWPHAGLKLPSLTHMTALSSTGIQSVMLSFLGSTCMMPSNLCVRKKNFRIGIR